MKTRGHSRRRAVLATAAASAIAVVGTGFTPASAATLGDYTITGVQFVNDDCSRNEYAIDAAITGTTDDVGGFDRVRFEVWDDGTKKDSRVLEVEVGQTRELHAFLSFVGLYGLGAPGVGIVISDIDAGGNDLGYLEVVDPYYPEDVDGPCTFDVERIGGPDRIHTAAMLSEQKFVAADTVIIATSTKYPDALAAAPWAAQLGGPLLLSATAHLSAPAAAELTRLMPEQVIIVGGYSSISQTVQDEVDALLPGASVLRYGGPDRYATSAMIADEVVQDSSAEVFVASGQGFPDALVLSALAARHSAPLVLVKQDEVPAATAAVLAGMSYDDVYAAGGTSVISDAVLDEVAGGPTWTRYSGADRYATAAKVLEQFPAEGKVLVATGEKFPDSLTAVPVAARTGAGIALTRPDVLPPLVKTEIERLVTGFSFPLITIVGGVTSVYPSVQTELETLVGALGSPTTRPAGTLTTQNIPDSVLRD